MQRKRTPVPRPTIRHPDRKKEADRVACRRTPLGHAAWDITVAMAKAIDAEMIEELADAIEVKKAMAEPGLIPWEEVKARLGL